MGSTFTPGARDGTGVHGLNERFDVKSLYEGQTFLDRLARVLSS